MSLGSLKFYFIGENALFDEAIHRERETHSVVSFSMNVTNANSTYKCNEILACFNRRNIVQKKCLIAEMRIESF